MIKYISPDLVTFMIWSCDLHCILLNLVPLTLDHVTYTFYDIVTYTARSCDLYRPILWPFSSSFVPNIHRPNLWTLSPDLVTYTRNVVSYNTRSCDLYHRSLVTSIARFLTYYIIWFLYWSGLWPISPNLVTYIARYCDLYCPNFHMRIDWWCLILLLLNQLKSFN